MEHNSDEDEGFVANKLTIADTSPHNRKSRNNSRNVRPLDFQARYVFGEGIFRKQPLQSHNTIQNCNLEVVLTRTPRFKNRNKEQPEHPYQKYFINQSYKLIYSRNKEKRIDSQQINFCKNEVSLNSIALYDSSKFSLLKQFELKSTPLKSPDQLELEFDSRFQSGNLQWVFREKQLNSYILFIQNDTNTNGYNQWFYFSVKNMKPGVSYHFSIVNFKKKHSFFRDGKKLAVFSLKEAQQTSNGWSYQGENIVYERSPIGLQNLKLYCLRFDLSVRHDEDYLMIAMNFPYSYSKLISNLRQLQTKIRQQDQQSNVYFQMKTVAHSLSNNAVPYLTITSNRAAQVEKKVILMMARQHPGETWSSYLMEEFLKEITGGSKEAMWLLEHFVFKIFPMVNVDGVIYGNFRCDLGGVDLNRNWKYPSKLLHPQIYAIRQEIQLISQNYQIVSCLDLHGHSKQYNTFCYSCKTDNISCRVLPYIFSQLDQGFHFPYCTFGISKYKQSTARAVIFSIIKNPNVLTVECSFYGSKQSSLIRTYSPSIMNRVAVTLVKGLKCYYSQDQVRSEVQNQVNRDIKQLLQDELINGDEGGSESDPSEDEIQLTQKIGRIFPKSIISTVEGSTQKYKKKPKLTKAAAINKQKKSKADRNSSIKNPPNLDNSLTYPQKIIVERASTTLKKQHQQKIDKKQSQQKKPEQNKFQVNKDINKIKIKPKISNRTIQPRQQVNSSSKMGQTFVEDRLNNNNSYMSHQRQSSRLAPLRFKNQTQQLFRNDDLQPAPYKTLESNLKLTTMYDTKFLAIKSNTRDRQQFSHLCILSQSKKKKYAHSVRKNHQQKIDKMRQIKPAISYKHDHVSPSSHRVEMYRRMKDKERQNAQLLSKIWLQNMTRYANKPNVFLGSRAQEFI